MSRIRRPQRERTQTAPWRWWWPQPVPPDAVPEPGPRGDAYALARRFAELSAALRAPLWLRPTFPGALVSLQALGTILSTATVFTTTGPQILGAMLTTDHILLAVGDAALGTVLSTALVQVP